MKLNLFLVFSFLVLIQSQLFADTKGFRLSDNDCKTMASIVGEKEMKNDTGSKSINECSIKDKKVTCVLKFKADDKIFGSEEYKILIDSPELMLMTSDKGNVSYIIDKKAGSFIHAQHSYNEKLNGFISKSCIGKYLK